MTDTERSKLLGNYPEVDPELIAACVESRERQLTALGTFTEFSFDPSDRNGHAVKLELLMEATMCRIAAESTIFGHSGDPMHDRLVTVMWLRLLATDNQTLAKSDPNYPVVLM